MIIKQFAFGNESEAFVEKRFGRNLNIIFSNDNNKGKTLVLQGIMYALGNEPIFPAGFNATKYYFYTQFESNGIDYKVLRKNDVFSILADGKMIILESVSELKFYFDKNIFKLPEIVHRGFPKLVDLSLFFQLFFVGQDKRNTSSIFNNGYYQKADFVEMLYSMKGLSGAELTSEQIKEYKDKLTQLRRSEQKLNKEIDRFKINKATLENVKVSANYKFYQDQKIRLEKLNNQVSDLKKKRNRENSRLINHYRLKAELSSLNRTISLGKVTCGDCGSENISYKSKEVTFDITNKEVRSSILGSIEQNIQIKQEIIDQLDFQIERSQSELDTELSQVKPELKDLILFQDELKNSGSLDKELIQKQREIKALQEKLETSSEKREGLSTQQKQLINSILKAMNMVYKLVDETGIQSFDGLFTKKSVNYSGSEEQEFYFAKLYATYVVLKHDFPIVIDSFRDRELSTDKEIKMLDIFGSLDTQVIITSTLKREEYNTDKYQSYKNSKAIDYSSHQDSHILSKTFVGELKAICAQFSIAGF
jgi:hypothetical protein